MISLGKNKTAKLISEELNNPDKIERKQIDSICEAFSKLIQQCSKKELKVSDLKWQPHYSTVFKQLKSQLESILSSDSSKSLDKLNTIPYLLALKNEIFGLLNAFSKFVIGNAILIGTKDSTQRKNFFIKVVHFQFLSHEIQAYFPGGIYSPSKFKISKILARAWWDKMFGEKTFVEIDIFVNIFKEEYPFVNQAEILSFKNSINFTSTNFLTTFEFDLFTRLYSPWEKIQQAWRIIYYHPGYLHFSTYGDTKDILSHYLDKPGTYVFRVSCKDLGFWTIGYVKGSKDMGQIKVDKTNLIEALVEGHKKNMYLYPNGELCNPDLSNLNEFRKEIFVKNEELQLYDCFEDYKECKICREGEKDLQLESCGHQICQACYKLLRKYDKKLCPFCNQKILSTTKVVNVQNLYVDHNPAPTAALVTPVNDSVYADMTSENPEEAVHLDDDKIQVQARTNTVKRTLDSSIYSNVSDDVSSIEFSSLSITDGPPIPPRDKIPFVRKEPNKAEINYPPMQKLKMMETKPNQSISGVTPLKGNICPPSPLYSEMVSRYPRNNGPEAEVDDLYSDVNDPVNFDSVAANVKPIVNHHLSDEEYNAKYHIVTPIDPSLLDDTYFTPNDLIDTNTVQLDLKYVDTNPEEDADDIYSDPISMNYAPPLVSNVKSANNCVTTVKEVCPSSIVTNTSGHVFDPADDVYSNLDDVIVATPIDYFFADWDERDVTRALRVARNDRELARDILVEFVNRH